MSTSNSTRFQKVFNDVWNQLHRLQTHRTIYVCLFASQQSVKVLRTTALVTFGALQELLISALYLETHRLLDQATSRGNKTASVEGLIPNLPPSSAQLRRSLQRRLGAVRKDCEHLKDWRDRHVAHRDLDVVVREPFPLKPVNARTVDDAIEYVASALTEISRELNLEREYNLHREMDDVDVHKLLERLRAADRLAPNS
jgi:HEPN superfamily AbiU2-like protein